jgi:hypothetical protein
MWSASVRALSVWSRSRGLRLLIVLLLTGIAALFGAQLLAIYEHRLDYPIVDDWSYYLKAGRMPNELTLHWLFAPAVDTLHVTGKLLDWFYFRFVSHDYRSLALASFALAFGGWLVAAVCLCVAVCRRRPVILAASLLAFALPLANTPYWVAASPEQWLEPAIAYHQMLPVLGLILISLIVSSGLGMSARGPVIGIVALLTLAVSLVYSSGAVAMAVLGASLAVGSMILRRRGRGESGRLLILGVTVAAVAGAGLLGHVVATLAVHGLNPIAETRKGSPALPISASFWHFFLGLFDRAVLSTRVNSFSLARGLSVALAVLLPIPILASQLLRGRFDGEERERVLIVVGILLAVVCYAALVAYGRADFGGRYFAEMYPPEIEAGLYAHNRFFYWWISAILPLTAVAWGLAFEKLHSRRVACGAVVVLVLLALAPKGQQLDGEAFAYFDHWRYSARYARDAAELRQFIERDRRPFRVEQGAAVLGEKWARLDERRRNPRFRPADRTWMPGPNRTLYVVARESGATFPDRWGLNGEPGSFRSR